MAARRRRSSARSGAPGPRVVAERKNARKAARVLWRGLTRFNKEKAGPFRYSRVVLTARGKSAGIVGGVILQSWWTETYVELLWLSGRARGQGLGRELIEEAERRARRRGSRIMHLSTYSFQAPGFYQKLGFRRVGAMSGSPKGATRYYYLKRL